MRILIITTNVGKTAPGIVFERLIYGLSKIHTVDVLTSDCDPLIEQIHVNKIIEIKRKSIHHRISKLLISFFGLNPIDWIWSRKAILKLKKADYDLVFSFISFHSYSPLLAGILYSKSISSKFAVYAVDAIPAPLGWSENNRYFRQVKRMMAKYLPKADYFFSANEQMLEYQLTTFKPKIKGIYDVIYNPNDGEIKKFDNSSFKENIFLYTGGIYQARKADNILKAFEKLLLTHPNSLLVFVGTKLSDDILQIVGADTRKAIQMCPFAKDLTVYYEKSTALIDIDADLENDVFLSSKIINYLMINRIIVSETGKNSPSKRIFKGIPSILQCGHNFNEIAFAMKQAILKHGATDYNDRENVISLFNVDNVVKKINNRIGL